MNEEERQRECKCMSSGVDTVSFYTQSSRMRGYNSTDTTHTHVLEIYAKTVHRILVIHILRAKKQK